MVMTRRLSNSHSRMLQEDGRLQALLFQGFANLDSYRASGTEDLFFRRWAGAHAKVVSADQAMQRWRRLLNNFVMLLTTITGIAIVLVGGMRVMDGAITVGMLAAFQMLVANFNAPVASFVGLSAQLQDARGYIERLDDVLRQPTDPLFRSDRADRERARGCTGAIDVEALSFSHAEVNAPFFRNLDLAIAPGRRVAWSAPPAAASRRWGGCSSGSRCRRPASPASTASRCRSSTTSRCAPPSPTSSRA